MTQGHRISLTRALTMLFFVFTSLYSLIAASPFAYQQFIKPRLLVWLVWTISFYPAIFLGVFSLTLLSLLPDIAHSSRRAPALALVALWGAAALALFVWPVMDWLQNNNWSLVVAVAATIPIWWLSVIDHLACRQTVFRRQNRPDLQDQRIFGAALAAGAYVWGIYGLFAAMRRDEVGFGAAEWMLSAGRSLLLHLAAFAAVAWLFATALAVARRLRASMWTEHVVAVGFLVVWLFALLVRLVFPSLALRGVGAVCAAGALAGAIAAGWSGIALRLAVHEAPPTSGLDIFFRPALPRSSTRFVVGWLTILPAIAYLGLALSSRMDWAFLLRKTSVLFIWLLTWAAMFAMTKGGRGVSRRTAAVGMVLLAVGLLGARALDARGSAPSGMREWSVLNDRYAVFDASFKTLDDALAGRPGASPEFYKFLIANTNVDPAVSIAPASIDFVKAWRPRQPDRPPHIFLFVIDSLRRDYVPPYNEAAVAFAPRIAEFARESLVFDNAFSRYGGTGLALPSIWSGSLLPHREYVMPFGPMNALGKLLEHEQYRLLMGRDWIIDRLMPRSPATVTLGPQAAVGLRGLCEALVDLRAALDASPDSAPVFGYARPENIHILTVLGHPYSGPSWPGFFAPVAARVHELDGCFGSFIDYLKASRLYENSIVVLTADHGDSLGEDGRWGHAQTGFPEIFRIPLIVHVPRDLAEQLSGDEQSLVFSTDLTPTLYEVLGYPPELHGRLFGTPFLRRAGSPPRDRRRDSVLLASSYGPTYALLSNNGRRLYVVDATTSRDYAFDLSVAPLGTRIAVTAEERARNERAIIDQVREIGEFFQFEAQP